MLFRYRPQINSVGKDKRNRSRRIYFLIGLIMILSILMTGLGFGLEWSRSMPVPNQPVTVVFGFTTTTTGAITIATTFQVSSTGCTISDIFSSSTIGTINVIELYDTSSSGGISSATFKFSLWIGSAGVYHLPFSGGFKFYEGCQVVQRAGWWTGVGAYQ